MSRNLHHDSRDFTFRQPYGAVPCGSAVTLVFQADREAVPSQVLLRSWSTSGGEFIAKPEKVLEQINIDHRTAFVLMTHNYNYDLAMLRALLDIDIPYIGSLGPRKKLDRMINELKDKGMTISDAQMNKVFGPTGLDLGAETPEEIALSIASEIQTVLAKSIPISLRDAGEFIHSREGLHIISSLNQDDLL